MGGEAIIYDESAGNGGGVLIAAAAHVPDHDPGAHAHHPSAAPSLVKQLLLPSEEQILHVVGHQASVVPVSAAASAAGEYLGSAQTASTTTVSKADEAATAAADHHPPHHDEDQQVSLLDQPRCTLISTYCAGLPSVNSEYEYVLRESVCFDLQLLHAVTSVAEYSSSSIVTTAAASAAVAAATSGGGSMTEMAALLAQAVNVKNEPEDLTGGGSVATVNNNRRPSASDHDIHSR